LEKDKMKLKCRKSGNSWVVTIPKSFGRPEYVWVYSDEKISDSEMLYRIAKKIDDEKNKSISKEEFLNKYKEFK